MKKPHSTNYNPDHTETSKLIIFLMIVAASIFATTIVLCVWFSWGAVLGFSLFSTCFGLLMTAVLTITKLSDKRTFWLTLLGIFMSAAGYIACLQGVFHPVSQLYLKTNQSFEVSPDTANCKYVVAKSSLICDVAVQPK
ncbi:hypothetical protein [Pseudomonas sp. B6001]|uniref:hypothetical protein n=1 Tax=Pseudomonas sp. B6001 TaxID=2738813 RepID=UPI0015A2EB02|nr:hypothetical protein [Pseudomonas sp. B6001]NVZ93012.1 hypothetical protein [Pseudomonas sp. B6001]